LLHQCPQFLDCDGSHGSNIARRHGLGFTMKTSVFPNPVPSKCLFV
jgi:hypothetical protein